MCAVHMGATVGKIDADQVFYLPAVVSHITSRALSMGGIFFDPIMPADSI